MLPSIEEIVIGNKKVYWTKDEGGVSILDNATPKALKPQIKPNITERRSENIFTLTLTRVIPRLGECNYLDHNHLSVAIKFDTKNLSSAG